LAYALMGLSAAYVLAFDLSFALQCRPLHLVSLPYSRTWYVSDQIQAWKHWDGDLRGGTCNVSVNALGWSAAATNIAIDLGVIVLPLPQIFKLQLSWGKKVPLLLVFALGFL
jgi:hypothetical protein